jgi:hypothetical protein
MDIGRYLKIKSDKSAVFTGNEAIATISRRYENYKLLFVADTVRTLGIFDLEIDGHKVGFMLPASIDMCPSKVEDIKIDDENYVKCTFNKGDTFMVDTRVVQSANLAYTIFAEFVEKGKMPKFMKYEDYAFIFDTVQDVTGIKIPANHVTFEIIYAFLSRKHDDYTVQYRHTDMKKPNMFLRLSDTAHASFSVTSKLVSSYLSDGINAAIVNEAENESKLEELLRQ